MARLLRPQLLVLAALGGGRVPAAALHADLADRRQQHRRLHGDQACAKSAKIELGKNFERVPFSGMFLVFFFFFEITDAMGTTLYIREFAAEASDGQENERFFQLLLHAIRTRDLPSDTVTVSLRAGRVALT